MVSTFPDSEGTCYREAHVDFSLVCGKGAVTRRPVSCGAHKAAKSPLYDTASAAQPGPLGATLHSYKAVRC